MVVINSAGWYLISSDENESIDETIDNLKQNTNDSYTLYNRIYYYEDAWPKNNNFLDINWKSLDISDYIYGDIGKIYMDPNLGFWVLVTSYTVAPPEPEAEPGAEPGAEPIAEPEAEDSVSWLQIGSDIDGVSSSDNLGWSVAMNSDATRIVTGAPEIAEGHVRVYDWDGSNWTQIGYIVGEASGDKFGYSVAMNSSGTRIAIGATHNDSNYYNGNRRGHVRVYEYREYTQDDDDNNTYHYSSQEQGTTNNKPLIITESTTTAPVVGESYWMQVGSDIEGESNYDESGYSVAMSDDGSRIAIGARYNGGHGSGSGHVRVYDWNHGWTRVGGDIDGEASNDLSGYSVAMNSSGTRIAIGAISNDGINGNSSGHVRVYDWNDSSWTQVGGDIDGLYSGDRSGYSVAMSSDGTKIIIGAVYYGGINGLLTGCGLVYEYNSGSWSLLGNVIDNGADGDQSGYSVAMSSDGTRIAIGAPMNDGNDDNSGKVQVFDYKIPTAEEWSSKTIMKGSDTTQQANVYYWTQVANVIYGEKLYDQSGYSVAISSDGLKIAVGAPYNDGSALVTGDNRGHVRVYGFYDSLVEPEPEPEAEPEPESEPEGELEPDFASIEIFENIHIFNSTNSKSSNFDYIPINELNSKIYNNFALPLSGPDTDLNGDWASTDTPKLGSMGYTTTGISFQEEQVTRNGRNGTTARTTALIYNGYNMDGSQVDSSSENIIAEISLLNIHGYPIDTSNSTGQAYLNTVMINRLVHPNGGYYEPYDGASAEIAYCNSGGRVNSGGKLHFMVEFKNNIFLLLTGYRMQCRQSGSFEKEKVLGSNDGTTWTTIYENTNSPWTLISDHYDKILTFENTNLYSHFKFEYGGDSGENLSNNIWVPTTQLIGSYYNYNVGGIVTTYNFTNKLKTDLQTSITYSVDTDDNGDTISYLQFNDITADTTMNLTGIPLSIFDETHIYKQLTGALNQPRQVTLTASENKLYFKYLTLPDIMTIVNGDKSTQFQPGAIFIHSFIHQIETDLNLNITLNAYTNPDTLVFDTSNGDISLSGLDPFVFGVSTKTLTASDNILEMITYLEPEQEPESEPEPE